MTVPEQKGGAPEPQPSFTERKAEQLRTERAADEQPQFRPDPERTPVRDEESAVDGTQYEQPEGAIDEDYEEGESAFSEDPDGTPSDDDVELNSEHVDWESRYKSLQSETQSVREGYGEIQQEHAEAMSANLRYKFELEDKLTEATQRAEFFANTMAGNANQFRNIDWSRVPPDQLQAVQGQAQQAMVQEQQAIQAYQQVKHDSDQVREQQRGRELEISEMRLRRSIGLTKEKVGAMREFAVSGGMPTEKFRDYVTDPFVMECIYSAMQTRQAGNTVRTNPTKRNAQNPRGKAARQKPRDARGKFARTDVVPNQRGSFADKHQHRLAMERQGR